MRPYKSSSKKKFFIFILIFLSLVFMATLASFLFFGKEKKNIKEVLLKIEGPTQIASGEEITYSLIIENQEETTLKNLEMSLRFPQGFYWRSSEPTSLNPLHTIYQWPELKSGKKEKLEIKGQIIGQMNEEKILEAILTYQPVNFHSYLEKKANFVNKITSSTLEIDLQGPEKSLTNQEVNYNIKLKNISKAPLGKIKVSVVLPIDLKIKEISPESKEEEKNIWIFEKIDAAPVFKQGTAPASAENFKEIKIKGVLTGPPGQQEEIKVQAGLLAEDGFVLQAEAKLITLLFQPKLSLNFTANEKEEVVVNWGESLNYLVKFKNESNLEMASLNFKKILTSHSEQEKFFEATKNPLTNWKFEEGKWKIENPEQIPVLESLKPQEQGEINFRINLSEPLGLNKENISIESKFEIEASLPEIENQKIIFQSKTLITKIRSKIILKTEARYYDDNYQIVGTGPLPPKVGQETLYQIYWSLKNTTNKLKKIKVKTKLPPEINFLSLPVETGQIVFDSRTREVTWTINEISPWQSGLKANFQISIIPTLDQVGKILILAGPTNLEAQDQFTQTDINIEQPALLSDLAFDPIAKGKGMVEE